MKPKKIFGWIFVFLGAAIIVWTLYSSYNIFTGVKAAPAIFKTTEKEEITSLPRDKKTLNPLELQEEMEKMVSEQIKDIIPAEFLSKLLNLISWSILAGIFIFGGTKIAGIGINLLKKE